MAKRAVKKKVEATPEMIAKAKKLKAEGKSYKAIATALGYKYDKAAWNLLNPGPTGRHRGDRAVKASPKAVPKGRGKAGRAVAAEGSVGARRTGRKRGKRGTVSPVESPASPAQGGPSGESTNKPGSLLTGRRFGQDRPVATPAPMPNGHKEEVKAVPKPKDRKRS